MRGEPRSDGGWLSMEPESRKEASIPGASATLASGLPVPSRPSGSRLQAVCKSNAANSRTTRLIVIKRTPAARLCTPARGQIAPSQEKARVHSAHLDGGARRRRRGRDRCRRACSDTIALARLARSREGDPLPLDSFLHPSPARPPLPDGVLDPRPAGSTAARQGRSLAGSELRERVDRASRVDVVGVREAPEPLHADGSLGR